MQANCHAIIIAMILHMGGKWHAILYTKNFKKITMIHI